MIAAGPIERRDRSPDPSYDAHSANCARTLGTSITEFVVVTGIPGLVLKPISREGHGMPLWRPDEVEEVFCRSGGPGGQHVNKVSTAVTLRHLPTGLSVRVSSSRSQARNRAEAMRLLAAKLESAAAAARQARLAEASKNRRRRAKRSGATKRRLVEIKRRRGETKQLRKQVS
jgi:hypothetical protein